MMYSLSYIESSWRKFEKNEKHVTRVYEQNVLIFMYSGVLRFSEDGVPCELTSGEYYIQKKNLFQEGLVASDVPEYFFIHFKGDCQGLFADIPLRGTFAKDALKPVFDTLINPLASAYKKQAHFFEILDILSSSHKDVSLLETRLKIYIDTHFSESLCLSDMAKEFSYSERYLEILFKKSFGISLHKYIIKKRIEKAKFILKTSNQSIESIAYQCGYSEFSTFYRNFTAEEKISPLKWRKSMIRV